MRALTQTAEREADLCEHGRLSSSQASNKRFQEIGENGSDRGSSFAKEVNDEVSDEETSCFRVRRLQLFRNLSEHKLET